MDVEGCQYRVYYDANGADSGTVPVDENVYNEDRGGGA